MAKMAMNGGKPAKKSNFTYGSGSAPAAKKVAVKQDMIDFIKAQGMTKALKRAGQMSAKGTKGEAEFLEGVKRMYGANRLAAATAKATPAKAPVLKKSAPNKSAAVSRARGTTKPAPKPSKKSTTTDPFAKAVFGVTKKVGAAFTPDWKKKEAAMKAAKNK